MPQLVPLVTEPAPALPGGKRTICTGCRVSMQTAHTEEECYDMREERRMKNYDPECC